MSTNLKKLPAACCPPPARKAFTLVEMLVVITIIGILVALSSVAVFKALEAAKRARIKAEITNLESALQQFKSKYGDYPPSDFISGNLATDPQHPVRRFVDRVASRQEEPATTWQNLAALKLNPAQAMCFWLRGFSKDPRFPLTGTADRTPFFDFDVSRLYLKDMTTHWDPSATDIPVYMPQSCKVPYFYFQYNSYVAHNQSPIAVTGAGSVVPYLWDANADRKFDNKDWDKTPSTLDNKLSQSEYSGMYVNPKSFQIISAGLDNDFGTSSTTSPLSIPLAAGSNLSLSQTKAYPTGLGYDKNNADEDNLTNFSERPLGDAPDRE